MSRKTILRQRIANLQKQIRQAEGELREGAVDKVALFSEFETTISAEQLEEIVLQSYPTAIPGSLRINPEVQDYSRGSRGSYFFNYSMDDESGEILGGSIIVDSTCNGGALGSIRTYAYIRVDG